MDASRKALTIVVGTMLMLIMASMGPEPFPFPTSEAATTATGGLLRAFPGAEGWGATALNECRSRPIQVLAVTNANSQGPGSLDHAIREVRSDRFTFVIFRTGGHILAPRRRGIRLNASCVYVAGQTAPGHGIVIEGRGTAFWLRGGGPNISDVVMRYLRFRGSTGRTRNNLIVAKGEHIVLDHMSFSWTDNYVLALLRYGGKSWSAPVADISLQNSIISEAFAVHPTAVQIGSNEALRYTPVIGMANISFHRNLFAHNGHRNPNSGADNALYANNVIYNWNQGALQLAMRGKADLVNNFGKPGPMTHARYGYMINPRCEPHGTISGFDIYAVGNIGPMSDDPHGDNWSGSTRQVACYYRSGTANAEEAPGSWRREVPQDWATISFPVRLLPAQQAYHAVLDDVGANARLSCEGVWESALDPVDERIISEARSGTGPSKPPVDESSAGAWPTYARGTPCKDADGDGLPDAWEERFFGCVTCADPGSVSRDGYLVIEHYLNGTSPSWVAR